MPAEALSLDPGTGRKRLTIKADNTLVIASSVSNGGAESLQALEQDTEGLIDGLADPISGAHMVARWKEVVGKGTLVELPGIGHYPQIEAPQDVAAHVRAFLSRVDGP